MVSDVCLCFDKETTKYNCRIEKQEGRNCNAVAWGSPCKQQAEKQDWGGDWVGKGSSSHPSQFPFLCQSTELILLSHHSGSAALKKIVL